MATTDAELLANDYSDAELDRWLQEKVAADDEAVEVELGVLDVEEELAARPPSRGQAGDIFVGAATGALDALQEQSQAGASLAEWLAEADLGPLEAIPQLRAVQLFAQGAEAAGVTDAIQEMDLTEGGDAETVAGGLAQGVTQFLTGWVTGGRAVGLAKAGLARYASAAGRGAVVDATAFDPFDDRLSNLVENYEDLRNPVTEYLAADPTDTEAEGRFKSSLEGLLLGVVADSVIEGFARTVRGVRARRAARAEGIDVELPDRELPPLPDEAADDAVEGATDEAADEAADDAADEAADEAVEPEEPLVEGAERRFRAEMQISPVNRSLLQEALARGDWNAAEDMIDFNAETVDWSRVSDPEEIMGIINTTSEVLADFIDDAKGGVQTLAKTRQLADRVGASAEEAAQFFADVRGGGGLAARHLAVSRLMTASADHLRQLARKMEANPSVENDLAFSRHVELHGLIQAQVKGARTEIARALHSMRAIDAVAGEAFDEVDAIIRNIGGNNLDRRRKLASQFARVSSERELNYKVRRSRWQRAGDAVIEFYIQGLLSAMSTQALNTASNILKVLEGVMEGYTSAGIGALRRNANRATVGEANYRVYGTILGARQAFTGTLGAIKDGDWKRFMRDLGDTPVGRAFRDEEPTLDRRQRVDVDTMQAIALRPRSYHRVAQATYRDQTTWLERLGYFRDPATGDLLIPKQWEARAANALGRLIRLPGRTILATDEFFKTVGYMQSVAGESYRVASQIADERGLTGTARADFIRVEARRLIDNPTSAMRDDALEYARYQTFQEELGETGKAFEDVLRKVPPMRLIVPFFRTPVNIVSQAAFERSPLTLLTPSLWRTLARGGPEADTALARLAFGTTVTGLVMLAAVEGRITGSGLGANERNSERLDGIPPYSMKIGDSWYQYNRLEPLGLVMGLAADSVELVANYGEERYDDAAGMAAGVAAVLAQNITDKTWFKGVSDFVKLLDDPKRYADRWVTDTTLNLTAPFSSAVRRTTSDFDETARLAWTWADAYRSRTPGLSKDLPPRRDLLGNEVIRTDYVGPAFVSPFAVGKETDNPVYAELARLEFYYDMPRRDLFVPGEDVDAATYSEYLRVRGQVPIGGATLEERLGQLIESPVYRDSLSDIGREELVKDLIRDYGRAARNQMIAENPELMDQVINAKLKTELDQLARPGELIREALQ